MLFSAQMNTTTLKFVPHWNTTAWLIPTLVGAILLYINLEKGLLQFDEADYVTAARRGLRANYFDAGAMPILDFVKMGVSSAVLGQHGTIAKKVRERNDINFYRHNHAPLMFYALAAAGKAFGSSDKVFRMVEWLSAVLIILAACWGMIMILGEEGRWIAFLAGLFIASSPMVHAISAHISVHALYTAIALLTIAMQIRYFQTGRIRDFYYFVSLMALAFLTNEFASFLLASCVLGFLLVNNDIFSFEQKSLRVSYHLMGGIALFVLIFLLLWPAGVFKLSVVKSYTFFAYFALVKKELAYGNQSVIQNWLQRLLQDPVESVLILFGLGFAVYGFIRIHLHRTLLPLLIYPAVIFAANILNRGASSVYVLSMYPPMLILSALGLVHLCRLNKNQVLGHGIALVTVAIAMIGNFTLHKMEKPQDISPLQTAFTVLRANAGLDDKILVSYGYLPTMNYYLPEYDIFTIYLEDKPENISLKFERQFYKYFIFFGTENEIRRAAYQQSLISNYREMRRIPNSQQETLIIFEAI